MNYDTAVKHKYENTQAKDWSQVHHVVQVRDEYMHLTLNLTYDMKWTVKQARAKRTADGSLG